MQEVFTSPYSTSAAKALGKNENPSSTPALALLNASKKSNKLNHGELQRIAKELYAKIFDESLQTLIESFDDNLPKRPMRMYSRAVKTIAICSLYLIAVENSRNLPPEWLVAVLLETMRHGDKLELEPQSSDIIYEFGAHSKSDLIEGIAKLSMSQINCHGPVVKRLAERISANSHKRFEIFEKALRNRNH